MIPMMDVRTIYHVLTMARMKVHGMAWHSMVTSQVVVGMVLTVCVPALYLLIPDLFYGKATWYDSWLR